MKAHLLYRDRDFDPGQLSPPGGDELVRDLGLAAVFHAMSEGNTVFAEVARKLMLASTSDIDVILYRQNVLRDCLQNGTIVRQIYDLADGAIEEERRDIFGRLPHSSASSVLFRSISLLQSLTGVLQRLRGMADQHLAAFESEGFRTLLQMLRRELSDEYFVTIREHLRQLQFSDGVLISAHLGEGNKGKDYVLRRQRAREGGWMRHVFGPKPSGYSFRIADRDDAGARALDNLRTRGLSHIARALGCSTDHILSFLKMLRAELAFYLACSNLHRRLTAQGEVCFPVPTASDERTHDAIDLYDPGLALHMGRGVVSNDVQADDKELVIITGANQGGKSTFLRSIGLAQLMMQCGMFVCARAFRVNVCERIFAHFKREEDPNMISGKLDEELSRMSAVVDNLVPNSLLLFNESFAATNEREGSEIAEQVVSALVERRIKVFFVTHQYEFAYRFKARNLPTALFLRAERGPDGTRTFKIIRGDPQETSHGEDLYRQIFVGPTAKAGRGSQGEARPESAQGSQNLA